MSYRKVLSKTHTQLLILKYLLTCAMDNLRMRKFAV